MSIQLVQSATGTTGNYDSTTLAFGSNVVAGNLLVCMGAVWNGTEISSITITDTIGTSYTVVLGASSGGIPNKTWIAYGIAPSSGANTVTINPNGGGRYSSHCVAEFSGVHAAVPLDADGGSSTGSSSTASDAVTTVDANTLVLGVMSHGSGGNHALTEDTAGGWTLLQENENAGNAPYATAYQIFTSAGAKTASWTIAASVAWTAQTCAFKQAATAPPFTMRQSTLRGGDVLRGTTVVSGLSATVNQAVETDTGQAIARRKTKGLSQVSETEAAQAMARTKRLAIAQAVETDTPQSLTRRKTILVGQATEADTAQGVTRAGQTVAVAQAVEAETAQALTRRKAKTITQVVETDSTQTLTRRKAKPVGQVIDTNTAPPVTRNKRRSLTQTTETNTPQSVARAKAKTLGQVTELDTPQSLTRRKTKAISQAAETDTAQSITRGGQVQTIAQAVETDTAQAIARRKTRTIGQAAETDTAQGVTRRKLRTVSQVSESEIGQALTHNKTRSLGQAVETDTAQPLTTSGRTIVVNQAVEADSSQPMTVRKSKPIVLVAELELAFAVARLKAKAVGQASEVDSAQVVRWAPKILVLGTAVETDTAQPVIAIKGVIIQRIVLADIAGSQPGLLAVGGQSAGVVAGVGGQAGMVTVVGRQAGGVDLVGGLGHLDDMVGG